MATSKQSLTLDTALVQEVKRRVGPRGVSAFVNQALDEKLQKSRILEFLAELEQAHGAASPKERRDAEAELAKVFRPG